MPVVKIDHRFKQRGGSLSWDGTRQSTEHYLVVTDEPKLSATLVVVLANAFEDAEGNNVPRLGTSHPQDAYAIATNIKADPASDDPLTWTVIVSYETQKADSTPPQAPDPLQQRFKFQWDATTERRVIEQTIAGPNPGDMPQPIVNSAGQAFDPPPEEDEPIVTLAFERNEALDRVAQANAFRNSINNTSWSVLGFLVPAGQARIVRMRSVYTLGRAGASAQYDHYFVNSVDIHFKEDGWDLSLLDRGTQELVQVGAALEPRNIADEEGEAIRAPQLLNGSGVRLPEGGVPVFLPFPVRRRLSFALLDIPTERP